MDEPKDEFEAEEKVEATWSVLAHQGTGNIPENSLFIGLPISVPHKYLTNVTNDGQKKILLKCIQKWVDLI